MLHTHTTFLLNWNGIVRIGQLAKEENRVGESLDYDKRRAPYGPKGWLSSLWFFFFFLHPTSELLKRVPKPHLPSVCTTQCDDLSNLTVFMCFSWGSVLRARVPRSQGWSGMSWSLSPRFIWLSVVKSTPPVVLPAHFSEFSLSQWKVNLSAAVSTVRNGAVFLTVTIEFRKVSYPNLNHGGLSPGRSGPSHTSLTRGAVFSEEPQVPKSIVNCFTD